MLEASRSAWIVGILQAEQIVYLSAPLREGMLLCKHVTALGFLALLVGGKDVPSSQLCKSAWKICKITFVHTVFAPDASENLGLLLKPGTLRGKQPAIGDSAFLLCYSEFD